MGVNPHPPFLYVGGHELLLHIFCKRNVFFLTISRWAVRKEATKSSFDALKFKELLFDFDLVASERSPK